MRLLMFGHYSHTGFGVVTETLAARFIAAGVDVRVIAVNHRGEPVRGPLAGRVWPANMFGDGFGGNISSAAIDGSLWTTLDPEDRWAPEQVLVVSDMSGFQGHIGKQITPQWRSLPVWHYCPIEGDNLPPSWPEVWAPFRPVAMSEYGRRVIEATTGRPVPMVYHGVDTDTFRPVGVEPIVAGPWAADTGWEGRTLRTKEDCRAAFGIAPGRKIVLRADRLVTRKFYHSLLAAMCEVFERDPAADLLIHCRPYDEGLNLYEEMGRLPKTLGRVFVTGAHDTWKGLPVEGLVALYNASDLYVSTSSEGFGLTIAEAMACGLPVVAMDHSSVTEVVGTAGVLVPPLRDSYGDTVRFHSQYGMDWAVPDPRAYVEPITHLLSKPAKRRALGDAGRAHVRRSFRWDEAAAKFLDLFASAQDAEAAA